MKIPHQISELVRALRRGHNMHRIGSIALVLCFMLLGTVKSWCDPSVEKAIQCESTVKSKPSNSSLLGRSEMQEPKPLPVIRLLRLQEIPVALCPQDLEEIFVNVRDPSSRVRTEEQRPEQVAPRAPAPSANTRSEQ